MPKKPSPTKDEIAGLEPFARLGPDRIAVVADRQQAEAAFAVLKDADVLGFDTESKPTFAIGEVSAGPHVVQFATAERAFVFQLHDPDCRAAVSRLISSPHPLKAGFGLAGDHVQIKRTLGVSPNAVLDLNTVFRDKGYGREIGVRGAVAVVFGRRFIKSRKATTSNWSNRQLSESQILYAANDAWAAIQVYRALGLAPRAAD